MRRILSGCWFLLGTLSLTGAPPIFKAPPAFPVSYPVLSIAVADFDGDGKPDVAAVTNVCPFCGGYVSILLNNGHGGYQPERRHPVGSGYLAPQPQAIATADLNGDGRPDLVVANPGDGTVSVLLNTGGGTFGGQKRYAVGTFAGSVAIGDFNGDGIPDVAVSGSELFGFNGYAILLGKGDGSFQPAAVHTIGYCGPIAVADFNRDGHLDLAMLNAQGLAVVLGKGDGTFGAPVEYAAGGENATLPVAGDFNGDGKPDLAVANGTSIVVLLGNGNGAFGAPVSYPVAGSLGLTVADLNGDGIPDLAAAGTTAVNVDNGVAVLLGRGDGTFRAASNLNVPGGPQSIAAADVNGNGRLDLVVGLSAFAVTVLEANGQGGFEAVPSGYPISGELASGDFDGDGNLDLAVSNGNGVAILFGYGDGTFQRPLYVSNLSGALAIGDLNGDGKPDLVIVPNSNFGSPGVVVVLLGRGNGNFLPPMNFPAGLQPGPPVLADFNGDGNVDVAVVNAAQNSGPGTVSVLLGTGDGTLSAPIVSAAGLEPAIAIAGDFNGDGKLDLAIAATGPNTIDILLGAGDGSFRTLPDFAAPPLRLASMVAADFNGDGLLDLAMGGEGTPAVYVLPGNGDGTFQAGSSFAAPSGVNWVGAADLNGDGIIDLLVMGDLSDSIAILAGKGDGSFATGRNYLAGLGTSAVIGTFVKGALPGVAVSTVGVFSGPLVVLANTTR